MGNTRSQISPANSQAGALHAVLEAYESTSALDFDRVIAILLASSPSEASEIVRVLGSLTDADPSVGRFLLAPGADTALTQLCHRAFADCPDLALALLAYLELVLASSAELHGALLRSAFYSFPHDVLHKVSGDVLCFARIPDRPLFEALMVTACISAVASFFAFPAALADERLGECLAVFRQNIRASEESIQFSALNGFARFFQTNCRFALFAIGGEVIADDIAEFLDSKIPSVARPALEVARAVALFPDKRYARLLLDRGLLSAAAVVGEIPDCRAAVLACLVAFLQHDGELVTLVVESAAARGAAAWLEGEAFAISALAFALCARILGFPQGVRFFLEGPALLPAAVQFLDAADGGDVCLFLTGIDALLFYAEGLGLLGRVRAMVVAAGVGLALPALAEREDVDWEACDIRGLLAALEWGAAGLG
jgi:hypothetical protein